MMGGAGPMGAVTGLRLAQYGFDVTMFDRMPTKKTKWRWRLRHALPAGIVVAIALLFAVGIAEICEVVRWQLSAEERWGTAGPAGGRRGGDALTPGGARVARIDGGVDQPV